ncbi:uncharacterized protein LOC125657108 isoform X2 [Ostrea edulis]|uniref:uncharacterized protein LOC125657108 isoform X2 n=1 Tax=Ostrea edulis TaxID=37623 RepID=UPI0024AEEBB0|nr:uncharacterized protein LOC125657108 isoform X2 [Ostrea edulis]
MYNRKTTPLMPIFNHKKRTREALIAEPGDSNNDTSQYMECRTGRQMYQSTPDSFDSKTWGKDESFRGQQQNSGTWGNDPSFRGHRQQNSGTWGNDPIFHGQQNSGTWGNDESFRGQQNSGTWGNDPIFHGQQNSGTWGNDPSFHGQQQNSGNHSNSRFQQHQSSGAIPQRGGDSNLNQHSLRQSRNTQRPSMELIPPNPPNPKSARYSLNQQSADAGNNYKRPLGMSQGRGTVNRGERVQQNTYSTSGRGRGNLNFKNTPSANVSRSSSGGRMYQNRDQTSWGHGDEWNRGGSHGDYRERTGRMDSQVYDGDESSYQRVDSGWVHPDVGASGSVTNMDRRYAPIVSSFQIPSASGDGSVPDSIPDRDTWYQSVWAQQQQGNQAEPLKVNKPSKTETKPVQKPALDRSLRIVATDLGGIKNWDHLRGSLSFLFEIFVQVNSATSKIPETDAKKFCIKEDSVTMDCIFYEIDHSLPKLTRGKIYRIIGSYDSNQDWIKCSSIREATQSEHAAHQKNVQICAQYKLKLSSVVREQ